MQRSTVLAVNRQGDVVRAYVYDEAKDGSGRLDLLIPTADTQTNRVDWVHISKNEHGVNFVYLDEDPSGLASAERDHYTPPPIIAPVGIQQPEPTPAFDPRDTNKDGTISKEEKKAGKKQE